MQELNPENFAGNASSIWKMLDELAESDPKGYEKFIKEQMEVGKGLTSRPKCRCVYKYTLKDGGNIFVNMCEWEYMNMPKSETDAIPMFCGDTYLVENVSTVCVALHPVVYRQHGFPLQDDSAIPSKRIGPKADELMALCLTFLEKEKAICTREYADFARTGNLPKLRPEWSTEPHGGVESMFKSLHYRNLNFAALAQEALSSSGLMAGKKAAGDMQQTAFEPKISLTADKPKETQSKGRPLIEEVVHKPPPPSWKLVKSPENPTLKYSISLPANVTLKDCELDISSTMLSLKIKGTEEFSGPYSVQFPEPVPPSKAKAKLNKKKNILNVHIPLE
nr:unnamed protein product [Spirometra erinaceieuropaei]